MPLPLLIVVTGLPASGKTTLSRRIANDLHLPLISRDGIKEILFDGLGWSDREWSKRLGKVSYELTYYFVQLHIASGQAVIVESNFTEQAVTAFSAIRRPLERVISLERVNVTDRSHATPMNRRGLSARTAIALTPNAVTHAATNKE